jgi:tetratricopeptide (TPR) repeat protein
VATFDAGEAEADAPQWQGLPAHVRAALVLSRADVHLRQHEYDATHAAAERALALLRSEPPGRATDLALARAHFLQGLVAFHRDDDRHTEEQLRHSLAIAERIGDQTLLAAGWMWLGWLAECRGDLARAEECAQRSLTAAEHSGNQAAIAEAWDLSGGVSYDRGDLARAEECAQRLLAISDRIGEQALSAAAWLSLGRVAWYRGDLAQAEEHFQRGLVIFERIGDQFGSVWCQVGLGDVACDRGELALAAAYFRRARRRARRIGDLRLQPLAIVGQARVCLRAGRVRHAAVLLEHARALLAQQRLVWHMLEAGLATAELQLYQGALLAAQAAAEETLQLAIDAEHRWEEALARRLLGQCALARCVPAEADVHLRTALAMQREMGAALEAARTRLLLAEAEVAVAQTGCIPEKARTLLAEARAGFSSCRAALDLAQAEQIAAAWRPC